MYVIIGKAVIDKLYIKKTLHVIERFGGIFTKYSNICIYKKI